jgi:hypothetical protein
MPRWMGRHGLQGVHFAARVSLIAACTRKKKKRPLPKSAEAFGYSLSGLESTAAATGAAGTGTATAAAHRVGGGDGKTGTVAGLDKVYLDGAAGGEEALFPQKADAVFFKSLIVLFWLIQSQSQ